MNTILIIAGIVIVAIVFLVIRKKSKSADYEYVDNLSMSDVIVFFKQKEILDKLRENADFIAVVIKENQPNDKLKIVACIFNKSTQKIEMPLKGWICKSMDEDLQNAFGDKPMLILQ